MTDPSDGNQRLTLDEVELHVAGLSDPIIAQLCEGPVPDLDRNDPAYWTSDDKDCRVCQALEPIQKNSPPAAILLDWHAFVSKSFEMLSDLAWADPPLTDEREAKLQDELLALFGVLAFTRCTVIYATARAEKLRRETGAAGTMARERSKLSTPVGGSHGD